MGYPVPMPPRERRPCRLCGAPIFGPPRAPDLCLDCAEKLEELAPARRWGLRACGEGRDLDPREALSSAWWVAIAVVLSLGALGFALGRACAWW